MEKLCIILAILGILYIQISLALDKPLKSGLDSPISASTRILRTRFEQLSRLKSSLLDDEAINAVSYEEKIALSVRNDVFLFCEGMIYVYVLVNSVIAKFMDNRTRKRIQIQNMMALGVVKLFNIFNALVEVRDACPEPLADTISNAALGNGTSNSTQTDPYDRMLKKVVESRDSRGLAYVIHSGLFQLSSWPMLFEAVPFIVSYLVIYVLAGLDQQSSVYKSIHNFLGLYLLDEERKILRFDDLFYLISLITQSVLLAQAILLGTIKGSSNIMVYILYAIFTWRYCMVIKSDSLITNLTSSSSVVADVLDGLRKFSGIVRDQYVIYKCKFDTGSKGSKGRRRKARKRRKEN